MITLLILKARIIQTEYKQRKLERNTMAQLKDKDLELINQQLKELQAIKADIVKAKEANVPGVEELETRCNDCLGRCEKFKQVYFPNKG